MTTSRRGEHVSSLVEDETARLQAQKLTAFESVRVWLYKTFFTSLCGVTFGDWCELLRDNRFAIDPSDWPRAALMTAGSALNSYYRRKEMKSYGASLAEVNVRPPVFILGHWRSGTTLLHNLLALDDRFAFPNLYEAFFPHTFLCTEEIRADQVAGLIPSTRQFDNMAQGLRMPNEDEFATSAVSLCSPYMLWAFPRNTARYERYFTFRGVPAAEVERWKSALVLFLKKLTLRYDRPMLLKSPPHTCRIRLLRELFPEARFIHIRREPFTVFQSTRHLNRVLTRSLQFHRSDPADLDAAVIRRYRLMYETYFDERPLVPATHFHELAFEDLERDPIGEIGRSYEALSLPGFGTILPRLEEYVTSLADYRKNSYPELPDDLRALIRREWRRSFECWGYPAE